MKISQFLVMLLLAAVSHSLPAEEITIAVASNFTTAMQSIVAKFETTSDHHVNVVFGSSGKFYAQIENGAPFQALFSADQMIPQALENEGLMVPGSRFTYATGALALWTGREGLSLGAATLKLGKFNKLALANPRLAPYGAAAVQVLQRLGLDTATRPKWVQGENIAQTFQFVDTGNADLGFVAVSQIMDRGQVRNGSAWIVPQELYQPIRQDAVLLRQGQTSRAAQEFLQFCRSPEAIRIMESFGYAAEASG